MIKLLRIVNEIILEAKFQDITVVPAKNIQRGISEPGAKSFDISIDNTDVVKKMKSTPMGKPGKMTAFSYEGPGSDTYKEFKWDADTSQWDVWKNMNYIILDPKHNAHWYHGKMPGGVYKDETGNLLPGSTGEPLPDLTVKAFGYKVYKALLLDPSVGYIVVSDESTTSEVKNAVYKKLINDEDFVWVMAGGSGDGRLDYDNIIFINPLYADEEKLAKEFEETHKNKKITKSSNFYKK